MKITVFPSDLPKPQIAGEAGQAVKINDKTHSCLSYKTAVWLALVQRLALLATVQIIGRYLRKHFLVSRESPLLAWVIIAAALRRERVQACGWRLPFLPEKPWWPSPETLASGLSAISHTAKVAYGWSKRFTDSGKMAFPFCPTCDEFIRRDCHSEWWWKLEIVFTRVWLSQDNFNTGLQVFPFYARLSVCLYVYYKTSSK